MDNEDVIRDQMEDTRTSLTEKLESLEEKVAGTVTGATSNVADTVEAVTGTVQDTLASMKDTVNAVKESVREGVTAVKGFLDIPAHVDRHPWAMMGGSVVLGFVTGALLGGRSGQTRRPAKDPRSSQHLLGNGNGRHLPPEAEQQPSEGLLSTFGPELSKLKGLALGALLGAVRDTIQKAVPPNMSSSLKDIIEKITQKLTGEPIDLGAKKEPFSGRRDTTPETINTPA